MQGTWFYMMHKGTPAQTGDVPWFDMMKPSWTAWIPSNLTGPSQFSHKNVFAARARSSPAASRMRNASRVMGKPGARPPSPLRCMTTRSDELICMPTPAMKGTQVRPCRGFVSANRVGRYLVTKRAMKRAALATDDQIENATSLVCGPLVDV